MKGAIHKSNILKFKKKIISINYILRWFENKNNNCCETKMWFVNKKKSYTNKILYLKFSIGENKTLVFYSIIFS